MREVHWVIVGYWVTNKVTALVCESGLTKTVITHVQQSRSLSVVHKLEQTSESHWRHSTGIWMLFPKSLITYKVGLDTKKWSFDQDHWSWWELSGWKCLLCKPDNLSLELPGTHSRGKDQLLKVAFWFLMHTRGTCPNMTVFDTIRMCTYVIMIIVMIWFH